MHHRPEQLPTLIQAKDNALHESKKIERDLIFPDDNLSAPIKSNDSKARLLRTENKWTKISMRKKHSDTQQFG